MIDSLVYGFFAASLLIFLNYLVLKIYKHFPVYGIALVWGSLGIKLLFISAFTILIQHFVKEPIIYAFIILAGILFSNVQTLLTLKKNGDI
jgi:MFS superfamily sulfate permease-like transporter